jgi:acetyl esterase
VTEATRPEAGGGYAIDPELADLLALLPTGSFDDLQAARDGLDEMLPILNANLDLAGLVVEDRIVAGPADHARLAVRTYVPELDPSGAGLVFIHGGGFTLGNLESEHSRAAGIARDSGAVVVSVDYRLAPEHPFPAGIEDCFAALRWMHESSESLGVDGARIGVIGQSAGGGLAAGLALLARDRGGPPLCFQYLGVPEIDDRLATGSMRRFDDTPMWNRPAAASSWRMYLGSSSADDRNEVSVYAAPARATDLRGLPPTYISAMEFDPLRDEGIQYARDLLAAGVSCELHVFPGSFHGSSSVVTTAEVSRRELDEMAAVLRRRL